MTENLVEGHAIELEIETRVMGKPTEVLGSHKWIEAGVIENEIEVLVS
jgi:hypothetical protein